MDVFATFNKISREKLFLFKKISELKKGIFFAYIPYKVNPLTEIQKFIWIVMTTIFQ